MTNYNLFSLRKASALNVFKNTPLQLDSLVISKLLVKSNLQLDKLDNDSSETFYFLNIFHYLLIISTDREGEFLSC